MERNENPLGLATSSCTPESPLVSQRLLMTRHALASNLPRPRGGPDPREIRG